MEPVNRSARQESSIAGTNTNEAVGTEELFPGQWNWKGSGEMAEGPWERGGDLASCRETFSQRPLPGYGGQAVCPKSVVCCLLQCVSCSALCCDPAPSPATLSQAVGVWEHKEGMAGVVSVSRGEDREAASTFKRRTGTGSDQENVSHPGTCRGPREGAGVAVGCAMGKEPLYLDVERMGNVRRLEPLRKPGRS